MIDRIERAHASIDHAFINSREVDWRGSILKLEIENPLRSFKGRGADWLLQSLSRDKPLITASAGNFGAAIAYAARRHGHEAHVFASANASPVKLGVMRSLGATVVVGGRDFDEAKARATEFAKNSGGRFIEDGREPEITEGAGTIGLELTRDHGELDAVVVPVGNGALINGIGEWIKAKSPRTRVIGVCAAAAPSMLESWRSGTPVTTENADTIADGVAVRVPVAVAVEQMRRVVDEVVTVTDDDIRAAMRELRSDLGLVVEPAGAVSAAAWRTGALACPGKPALIVTGANINGQQWNAVTEIDGK